MFSGVWSGRQVSISPMILIIMLSNSQSDFGIELSFRFCCLLWYFPVKNVKALPSSFSWTWTDTTETELLIAPFRDGSTSISST
jgi:hypothetical protein